MGNGVDTNCNCQNIAQNIKNAGKSFVCRYYNVNDPSKNLTLAEAKALSNAGLYIIAVWENGNPTSPSYFNYNQGVSDATNAYNYALNTISQPAGTPIYFGVDYDASYSDYSGGILGYFNGIQDQFSTMGDQYSIGVYGSGDVCAYEYNNVSAVCYTWLARSTAWSGYNTFTTWNLKQGSTIYISGVPFDTNVSNGNAGGFQRF